MEENNAIGTRDNDLTNPCLPYAPSQRYPLKSPQLTFINLRQQAKRAEGLYKYFSPVTKLILTFPIFEDRILRYYISPRQHTHQDKQLRSPIIEDRTCH